jgi:hypothetical protein
MLLPTVEAGFSNFGYELSVALFYFPPANF